MRAACAHVVEHEVGRAAGEVAPDREGPMVAHLPAATTLMVPVRVTFGKSWSGVVDRRSSGQRDEGAAEGIGASAAVVEVNAGRRLSGGDLRRKCAVVLCLASEHCARLAALADANAF